MGKAIDFEAIHFDELQEILLDAARKAFRSIQAAHPDETFYMFGLYYDFLQGVTPLYHSEEAHLRRGKLTAYDRDHQTLEWFYARYRLYHLEYDLWGYEHFVSVSKWLANNLFPFRRIEDEEEYSALMAAEDAIALICLSVLKILDEEKTFGEGSAREKIVLNIFNDKQHQGEVEEVDYAYLLNPLSTYKRWRIEQELGDHARLFLERDQEVR